MSEELAFRAHARLLTMLGDQLIRNERIALVELVKNSYDADATRVVVDFQKFAPDFSGRPGATIVITDNGVGMTNGLVRTAWMNPATPSKALVKRDEPKTNLGRVLQGEKGIGRFAAFKLGSQVSLVTRAKDRDDETTLVVDITALDDTDGIATRIDFYLDDVPALIDVGKPTVFDGAGDGASTHGTRLEIAGIRAAWTETLIQKAFDDLDRLQPIMWGDGEDSQVRTDFEVVFERDGIDMRLGVARAEQLSAVLERAVLKVKNGKFDDVARTLSFTLNDRTISLDIDDAEVRGLKPFKDRFLKDANGKDLPLDTRPNPECGPFGFEFYVFDFSTSAPAQYSLDRDEKTLLRNHRIYLYRDGIRVYPYGDPDDDWLEIDVQRGTESAGRTLSNDQTVGYVTITQADNQNLKDKTSREGLLERGRATGDFRTLIQTVLRYLRTRPYQRYVEANRRAREQSLKKHRIDKHIQVIREADLPKKVLKELDALETALHAERDLFAIQIARTEQLAGVGLSVETASHDLILAGSEALRLARHIISELIVLDLREEPVFAIASSLVTRLEFVSARFQDVQGLFVSTRQKRTEQDIVRLLRRVRSIYAGLHKERGIVFEIDQDAALKAPSTEAAALQLLINLVDNATYWLMVSPHEPRIIRGFTPDPATLVVTDSGPGVKPQDAPYVFEPFYSGKGEDGKGLGLFIARQNGIRNGFSIDLSTTGDPRELAGATFVVRFGNPEAGDVDS